MLKILKRIVQDVTTSRHLSDALSVLVHRVHEAIGAELVSVYLIDHKNNDYVLIATAGLVQSKQGKVRVPLDYGLIGLVGRREEPINVDNAQEHPDFQPDLSLVDDHFEAFLGVPIIQHRKLYGVLVAQHTVTRCFDDAEEAFLITLAAQLGGIIAHAEATGELTKLTAKEDQINRVQALHVPTVLNGTGAVSGVAIGTAMVVYPLADLDAVPLYTIEDTAAEIALFDHALHNAREHIHRLGRRMKSSVAEDELALFDVYLRMLDKESLGAEVDALILSEHLGAQAALACVIKQHVMHCENLKDDYLRERASDFRDIGRRVLAELQYSQYQETDYPKRTILVGDEVTAAALAEVPAGQLVGIISAKGSNTSHVAILARALAVPTIMGVRGLQLEQLSRRAMIVDGYNGQLFISPSKALLLEYKQLLQEEDELNQSLTSLMDKPAETTDNHFISLQVNTGLAMDAGLSMSVGAEGVGLYRSEIPFMSRDRFPSEDEQYIIYKQILKAFAPRNVTMRTLDIGGDKMLPYFPVEEDNPFLGWRGIRVTLDHPDVFLMQVRAMIRADAELNNLRIMLPMVTTLSEVDDAKHLIDQAHAELLSEGHLVQKPRVGVMIEVPAAAYLAKEMANRVDFISVGSNDLTQYILAVDRNNVRVANLYDPLHPAVLRTLMKIVEGGHAAGVEVSLCGEMANDPVCVILLIAMGFDMLSMNSASLPRVKWVIRHFSMANARKILADVFVYEHPMQIRKYLQQVLDDHGLGGLIRAGKS